MKLNIKAIIGNNWLVFSVRLILGGCFFAASFGKLQNQSLFINTVMGYGILPDSLARLYGLLLPWAELFVGCALILGIFPVFASSLSVLLTISFSVASIYRLTSAVQKDCGCFGQLVQLSTPLSLTIDAVMLVIAVWLILGRAKTDLLSVGALLRRYIVTGRKGSIIWENASKSAVIAVIMLAIAFLPSSGSAQNPLDADINTALKSSKLALLYFYADGCLSCEAVKPVIEELEQKCNHRIAVLRLNYYDSSQAVSRFKVVTTPTIIEISGRAKNGEYTIYNRFEGNLDIKVLRDILILPCQ